MNQEKKGKSEPEQTHPFFPDGDLSREEVVEETIHKNIEKKLEEAEITLPPEKRKRVGLVVEQVIEESQFFSGPQPSPELLEKYERICPGWAEKLLQMGVNEQKHRHACEMRALDQQDRVLDLDNRDTTYAMTGLVFGFLALLVILGVGVYALVIGQTKVAIGCLGGGFIAAVVGVFVNGRSQKLPTTNTAPEANSKSKKQS
jgi:uncharacterized membrane protein